MPGNPGIDVMGQEATFRGPPGAPRSGSQPPNRDTAFWVGCGAVLETWRYMRINRLRRREFITLLGGTAAWPLAARAQQPAKLPTIGFLGSATASIWSPWTAVFVQRARELGWIEGRTVAIEYRWGEGRAERCAEIAAEFVRLKVDIIVTSGTPPVLAAKQATGVIPIVVAGVGDPVGNNLVASLARPGGNVTGLSIQQTDTAGKRIELFREVVPGLRRLAILANVGSSNAVVDMGEVQAIAGRLGLEVVTSEIRQAEDIVPAFEALNGRADALYVCADPLVLTSRIRINNLAQRAGLPTIYSFREFVESGGLISYGANFPDLFRRAADFVDKILRGAKPGEIPVEQPTRFDLTINLKTAKALGLTIPESFLLRADEVIE
jgi:putative ABC transport system substrate-binding protein